MGKGRGSGRGRGRGGYGGEKPHLRLCSYFIKRQCTNNTCQYSHAIKMHGEINASSSISQTKSPKNYHQRCNNIPNNKGNNNLIAGVTDVAIWEQQEGIKKFLEVSHSLQ